MSLKWTPDLARQWITVAEKLWADGNDLPLFAPLKKAQTALKAEVEKCGDEYSNSIMLQESLGKACIEFQIELNKALGNMQTLLGALGEL